MESDRNDTMRLAKVEDQLREQAHHLAELHRCIAKLQRQVAGLERRVLTGLAPSGAPTQPAPVVIDAGVVETPVPGFLKPEERREISRWGRLKRLVTLHDKISTLLRERGQHPEMQDVPGGKTGLVLKRFKTVVDGDSKRVVEEYVTDTGLVAEIRALIEQTAAELGEMDLMRAGLEMYSDGAMGTPDDDLVRQVLEAGHGATAAEIHLYLFSLRKAGNGGPKGWSWFPAVVEEHFGARSEA